MNASVISGLIKRRAELACDIEQVLEALRGMVQDLEKPARDYPQFEPDFRVEIIEPRRPARLYRCSQSRT